MMASLKAQFHEEIHLHEIVTLHALVGDDLAHKGMRGLQAQDMVQAVYRVVNGHTFAMSRKHSNYAFMVKYKA